MNIVAIIIGVLAIIAAFDPTAADKIELRVAGVIERICPTAHDAIVAAGGVADAWVQMRTGDPNATVDVLPRGAIRIGQELCAYYAPAPTVAPAEGE
jgi:hypothetical protein